MGKGGPKILDPDELLSTHNPVFVAFVFYAGLCLLKMVAMSWMTCHQRIKKKIFATKEDVQAFCEDKETKLVFDDEDVERIRRNHQNDMENIVPFVLIGFLFVLVNPNPRLAPWLFRAFTVSRCVHFASYQMPDRFPQPSRFASFLAGSAVNGIMAAYVILASFVV